MVQCRHSRVDCQIRCTNESFWPRRVLERQLSQLSITHLWPRGGYTIALCSREEEDFARRCCVIQNSRSPEAGRPTARYRTGGVNTPLYEKWCAYLLVNCDPRGTIIPKSIGTGFSFMSVWMFNRLLVYHFLLNLGYREITNTHLQGLTDRLEL